MPLYVLGNKEYLHKLYKESERHYLRNSTLDVRGDFNLVTVLFLSVLPLQSATKVTDDQSKMQQSRYLGIFWWVFQLFKKWLPYTESNIYSIHMNIRISNSEPAI